MLADDARRRLLKRRQVQRPFNSVDKAGLPRRTDRSGEWIGHHHAVLIHLGDGTMPRVKLGVNDLGREHSDCSRQGPVQCADQVRCGNTRGEADGCDLRQRVDAGICPARTLRQNCLAGDAMNCLRELTLESGQLRLHLPAVKIGAVIGKDQFPVF